MNVDALNELSSFLRTGESSPEKLQKILAKFTPEELESDEPIECCVVQRQFIEAAHQRAAFAVDTPGTCFPNPRDRQTHIDIRAAQEIAMAFCNVKDQFGGQMGNTVDDLAQRCLDAEAGSRKQSQLIEDLQGEVEDLKARIRGYGTGVGG